MGWLHYIDDYVKFQHDNDSKLKISIFLLCLI